MRMAGAFPLNINPIVSSRVLITGASSGIGYELARLYLQQGDFVFLIARSADVLSRLAAEFPERCMALPADLANEQDSMRVGECLAAATNYLDLVILNAGTCEYVDLDNFTREPFAKVMDVNWWGSVHSLLFCMPLLCNAAAMKRSPQLVGISSMASLLPMPRSQAYGASKVALEYLFNSLRVDVGQQNIGITIVRPGFVKTPLTERNDFAMPWLITAETAAKKIKQGIKLRKWIVQFPWPLVLLMKFVALLPLVVQVSLLKKISRNS